MRIINKGTTASTVIMQELSALFWLSAIYNFHITAVYLEGAKNTIADSLSRLHERNGPFSFYLFTCKAFSPAVANAMPLAVHISIHEQRFLSCRSTGPCCTRPAQFGDPAIRAQLFAESIKATNKTIATRISASAFIWVIPRSPCKILTFFSMLPP